ncbi:hypothetical protein MVES1_002057 [Malassezia vespertilionis]|uniref:2-dehydropantoate 2-reductase n=1 Tax=Malassezia vespertilionis TaxID=2020962 RepID=A0A2N1JBP4_9BASI|nr:uncharacterized protein MVES1_002057 [Malassezia vespertilionis]PKI83969.1 Pan5p [Malassezia vespertilionis]WFD06703.1 hypothetical protein MVES1_002057 [Malassezia vespertilionis]
MQAHIVGVGAIGTLLASHTRAILRQRQRTEVVGATMFGQNARSAKMAIPPHVVPYMPDASASSLTLHMRDRTYTSGKKVSGIVTAERDGVRMVESGCNVELASAAGPDHVRTFWPDAHGALQEVSGAQATAPIDSLLVTTKADAALGAIRRLVPRITPSTTVVLLQNGMGVLDTLLENLWRDPSLRPNVILASTTHGCYMKKPLHTIHAGFGALFFGIVPSARGGAHGFEQAVHTGLNTHTPLLDIGAIPDTAETRSLRETVALLLSLPLDVHWEPIRAFQLRALRKLVINACINPTTALADCKNGELFGSAPAWDLFQALCTEASQVLEAHARDAKAGEEASELESRYLSSLPLADLLTQTDMQGLPLLDASLKPASLLHEVENVVRNTASNWSSMHQDIKSRRGATEIDYINGYLSDLGP